ncbi:MAG TPA: hypothetical protein DEH27_02200, partial [Deltaproteobacteria bacterium]|nr:hypothetical protein [Deltaproteobacteria bacterium]
MSSMDRRARPDPITTGVPDSLTTRAASSFDVMPPVPMAWVRKVPATRSSSSSIVPITGIRCASAKRWGSRVKTPSLS